MRADVKHLKQMLNLLSKKTGHPLSPQGLYNIADDIKITRNYLYSKIYLEIQDKKKKKQLGLRDSILNDVAVFLGFVSYEKFVESLEQVKDLQLVSLVGTYYSYVRRIAPPPMVFRSPVRIWEEKDGKVMYELRGPSNVFKGEIKNRSGCLFVLMESEEGKAFQHVYKIGGRKVPLVLQGTFSGVSTAFDPIGGRTVLIKSDKSYDALTNQSMLIDDLKKSKQQDEQKLAVYFRDYENNNVSPNRAATFGLDDLEQ